MERKKIIELIKLEVLNCLNEKDREELQLLRLTSDDFPWKELAEYQLITALLPSVLELRNPAVELKDKTAMKLYNIRDEIKAKIDAKKALETVAIPVDEKLEDHEKTEFGEVLVEAERVEVEEEVVVEAGSGIQFGAVESALPKNDPFKVVSNYKEKTESSHNILQETREVIETAFSKHPPDKEMVEKITRDYINSHLAREIESLNQRLKQSRMLSFISFAVTLILIILLFLIK